MKLSLSVRIAELESRKDHAAMPIEQLAPLAREVGFQGLSMRASVVSVDSPTERVAEVRDLLDRLGLAVSMVTGDVPIAANTPEAVRILRDPEPYLALAEVLGSDMVRVMIRSDEEIDLARQVCDAAGQRGIRIAHQTHYRTLLESADEALDVVRRVDRPNFGITFEPSNMMICGNDYGPDAIRRLAPRLFNVYFQNMRVSPTAPIIWQTRSRGQVAAEYVPLHDRTAIDVVAMVDTLREVGYDGWFTVHQPLQPGQSVEDAVRESHRAVDGLIA
jgi:sugar phosphate isomerase/epimerase